MWAILFVTVAVAFGLVGCAPPEPSHHDAVPSAATESSARTSPFERGRVSLYGHEFADRATASGEQFDPEALTVAHRTLPFGTRVRVTNLEN